MRYVNAPLLAVRAVIGAGQGWTQHRVSGLNTTIGARNGQLDSSSGAILVKVNPYFIPRQAVEVVDQVLFVEGGEVVAGVRG